MFGTANKSFTYAKPATVDLAGKQIAVVGGTDGLGRAIAKLAAAKGAAVTVVGRTFRDEGVANITFKAADLSRMSEATRIGLELPGELDIVLFTTGIVAASTRQVSSEGIELDMAISTLSRHVILNSLMPRLRADARVFVMGFPGSGQWQEPVDLNSEESYAGGFGAVHIKTVNANEAIVLHWAAQGRFVYGLNPGLIKTNIRSNVYGTWTWMGSVVESILGFFTITPETYALNIVPLFVAPEVGTQRGLMFGQDGQAILPTPQLTPEKVGEYIRALDALAARAVSGATAAASSATSTSAAGAGAGADAPAASSSASSAPSAPAAATEAATATASTTVAAAAPVASASS